MSVLFDREQTDSMVLKNMKMTVAVIVLKLI